MRKTEEEEMSAVTIVDACHCDDREINDEKQN